VAARGEIVRRAAPLVDLGPHQATDLFIRQFPTWHLGGAKAIDGARDRTTRLPADLNGGVSALSIALSTERSAVARVESRFLRAARSDARRSVRQVSAGWMDTGRQSTRERPLLHAIFRRVDVQTRSLAVRGDWGGVAT
jgi:hypothetical protein